ncbi:MAG TPA: Gfo/Idh/MocA family oxidoreductase [Streptosporangiaceae bacterium]|nr:Gfo/Idh/MocA family oxidoreductase [Streptosporangiaceae bacterium]
MAVTVGLVGAGHRAADVYAPALASCPGTRFAGIWAPRPQAAGPLAEMYGVTAYERFEQLLDQCDAVAFAVPPAAQPDLAGAAARRGKAVLLEVPIAADLAGAEELAESATAARAVTQVALTWRYASAVRTFLSNSVPRIWPMGASARLISADLAPGSGVRPWRAEMGVLLSLGPHLLDLLDAALGRIGEVRAHGDPRGWVGMLLEHSDGRFSEVSLTAAANVETPRADVEVFGSGGEAAIECEAAARHDAVETMVREFVQAAEADRSPELDVNRGLHLQRIVEEAGTSLLRTA